jgi:hypothetical protein
LLMAPNIWTRRGGPSVFLLCVYLLFPLALQSWLDLWDRLAARRTSGTSGSLLRWVKYRREERHRLHLESSLSCWSTRTCHRSFTLLQRCSRHSFRQSRPSLHDCLSYLSPSVQHHISICSISLEPLFLSRPNHHQQHRYHRSRLIPRTSNYQTRLKRVSNTPLHITRKRPRSTHGRTLEPVVRYD